MVCYCPPPREVLRITILRTGPILPIGSDVLALTALNAFRPRRWRGALTT